MVRILFFSIFLYTFNYNFIFAFETACMQNSQTFPITINFTNPHSQSLEQILNKSNLQVIQEAIGIEWDLSFSTQEENKITTLPLLYHQTNSEVIQRDFLLIEMQNQCQSYIAPTNTIATIYGKKYFELQERMMQQDNISNTLVLRADFALNINCEFNDENCKTRIIVNDQFFTLELQKSLEDSYGTLIYFLTFYVPKDSHISARSYENQPFLWSYGAKYCDNSKRDLQQCSDEVFYQKQKKHKRIYMQEINDTLLTRLRKEL
ncbi:hypothetical protein CQA53_02640 [Helicobacter didelphidarum]|uniref:Uncharacterized protein n=1 Tax=Helicobacter didelphidarum TaxID=2040648 RepID=A0A3D8IQ03_9HELI|nr:hypothetical protein [Helicobacter didelphidarum]RDU66691.1 hypothetical protein CQA53_02640 [Helicobacter didelphidarum]